MHAHDLACMHDAATNTRAGGRAPSAISCMTGGQGAEQRAARIFARRPRPPGRPETSATQKRVRTAPRAALGGARAPDLHAVALVDGDGRHVPGDLHLQRRAVDELADGHQVVEHYARARALVHCDRVDLALDLPRRGPPCGDCRAETLRRQPLRQSPRGDAATPAAQALSCYAAQLRAGQGGQARPAAAGSAPRCPAR